MTDEVKELAPVPAEHLTALEVIARMVEQGAPKETVEMAFQMTRQWKLDAAAEKFAKALTGFKSECPQIEKTRHAGEAGKFEFMYAPLEDIDTKIRPLMTKYEIVDTYDTKILSEAGIIETTCHIRVGLHRESAMVPLCIPKGGGANNTQLMIQATSYGRRVALCLALGIVLRGEDKDGGGLHDTIDKEQVAKINDLISQIRQAGAQIELSDFLAFAFEVDKTDLDKAVHSLDKLPLSRYQVCGSMLADKLNHAKKKAAKK